MSTLVLTKHKHLANCNGRPFPAVMGIMVSLRRRKEIITAPFPQGKCRPINTNHLTSCKFTISFIISCQMDTATIPINLSMVSPLGLLYSRYVWMTLNLEIRVPHNEWGCVWGHIPYWNMQCRDRYRWWQQIPDWIILPANQISHNGTLIILWIRFYAL